MNRVAFGPIDYAPCADFGLLKKAYDTAEAKMSLYVSEMYLQQTNFTMKTT